MIAPHLRTCCDREIGALFCVDEDQANVVLGLDLVLLGAAQVSDEPDQAGLALGPRLQRTRAQAPGKARGQHAGADLVDDVPDPADVLLAAHAGSTAEPAVLFQGCAARSGAGLNTTSTRRFFWRPCGSSLPSAVVLGATGLVLPKPLIGVAAGTMPRPASHSRTVVARASESLSLSHRCGLRCATACRRAWRSRARRRSASPRLPAAGWPCRNRTARRRPRSSAARSGSPRSRAPPGSP